MEKNNVNKLIEEKGNFWFMEDIFPEVYRSLLTAEKAARMDFEKTGNEIRDALEYMIAKIIEINDFERFTGKSSTLNDKINFLIQQNKKAGLSRGRNQILPNMKRVNGEFVIGGLREVGALNFLRYWGNSCAHTGVDPNTLLINYKNAITALRSFYDFLISYYRNIDNEFIVGFKEGLMPIGDYHIEKSVVPADVQRSKCIRELLGYKKNSSGRVISNAIIRIYNKSDIDERFILRNVDAFFEASSSTIQEVPEGLARIEEISKYDNEASSFYIISYVFKQKPMELSNKLLKNMSMTARLDLCRGIARCFKSLHTADVPVYHRLLSYESIYASQYKDNLIPYVIKLDFAKIDFGDASRTIINNALEAKERIKELKQIKYLAPEWNNVNEAGNMLWDKVDIFSLGILFSDILSGEINTSSPLLEDLEEKGVSDGILCLLDDMRSEVPSLRPDIHRVMEVLNGEV